MTPLHAEPPPDLAQAAAKQASGARAIPAPICPMPGSRWAMPVLMTGADPALDDPAQVDGRSACPTNPSGGRREVGVAGQGDPLHLAGVAERVLGRAAHEPHDGRGRRHREAADAARLGDGAVAEVRVGVSRAVAGEVEAVRHAWPAP